MAGPITAETLAAQYGVSEKTIRRDGKRAEAIEKLAETQPEQAQLVVNVVHDSHPPHVQLPSGLGNSGQQFVAEQNR